VTIAGMHLRSGGAAPRDVGQDCACQGQNGCVSGIPDTLLSKASTADGLEQGSLLNLATDWQARHLGSISNLVTRARTMELPI
jgi:hypothetical protein